MKTRITKPFWASIVLCVGLGFIASGERFGLMPIEKTLRFFLGSLMVLSVIRVKGELE